MLCPVHTSLYRVFTGGDALQKDAILDKFRSCARGAGDELRN